MDDEDSQGDLAKKRTARVQLANGAMEARAYVAPTPIPLDSDHKTIEMRTVAVDEALDPRRKATVARGMGEAVAMLEGEIVDPTTGQVIPAVDVHAVPNTPWAHGKRPTHLKGVAPPKIGATGAGSTAASRPGYGAYLAAGGIVVAALACAVLIVVTRGNATQPTGAKSAEAPPTSPAPRALEPKPVLERATEPPPVAAPPPSTAAPVDSGPPPVAPPPGKGALPPAKTAPVAPPPAKTNDRIF